MTEVNISKIVNALTIDVEDYFHTEAMSAVVSPGDWGCMPSRVERSMQALFEVLDQHDVRATFFFLGWVAERFPHLVREAVDLGHEIGCHSYWHRPVFQLTPKEFQEDTARAKDVIEQAGQVPVFGYRAPSFSLTPRVAWAGNILCRLGFRYDSSIHPIRHDFYANPNGHSFPHKIANGRIQEFPVTTARFLGQNLPVGGGAYLRVLPYQYIRWGIVRALTADRTPAVVYMHPWELDPEQPRLAVSLKSRFRQYTRLSATRGKLQRLLRDFSFAPLREVFPAVDQPEPTPAQGLAERVKTKKRNGQELVPETIEFTAELGNSQGSRGGLKQEARRRKGPDLANGTRD